MKNKLALVIGSLLFILTTNLFSQEIEFPEDKVKYTINVFQEECLVTIIADIDIEQGWHINGANLPLESFSIPTDLVLYPSSSYKTVGKVVEPTPHFEHDEIADEDLYYHSNSIVLRQKIKINSEKDFELKGRFGLQSDLVLVCGYLKLIFQLALKG